MISLLSFHHTTFTSTYMLMIHNCMIRHCRLYDMAVYILTKRLTACISDLAQSLAAHRHRLQLNTSKTELIWFGTRSSLAKIPSEHRSLSVVHLSFRVVTLSGILAFYFTVSFHETARQQGREFMLLSSAMTAPTPVLRGSRSHDATSNVTSRIPSRLL